MKKIGGRQFGTDIVDPSGGFPQTPAPARNPFTLAAMSEVEKNLGGVSVFPALRPGPKQSKPAKPPGQFVY
jgi:hypothetical protein